MDLAEFEAQVRNALAEARNVLGRIEMHVREHDEDRLLMAASRLYAQCCMHARDYLGSASQGHPRPRRLAEQIGPLVEQLEACRIPLERLDAHPTADELRALVAAAQTVPPKA